MLYRYDLLSGFCFDLGPEGFLDEAGRDAVLEVSWHSDEEVVTAITEDKMVRFEHKKSLTRGIPVCIPVSEAVVLAK